MTRPSSLLRLDVSVAVPLNLDATTRPSMTALTRAYAVAPATITAPLPLYVTLACSALTSQPLSSPTLYRWLPLPSLIHAYFPDHVPVHSLILPPCTCEVVVA